MSGIAKMYDTTVVPSKEEVARSWAGSVNLQGSYRLVDLDKEEVGVEVLIATDEDDRLVQIPFSYRSEEVDPQHTLSVVEHGVLGKRWITNALGDPVAVRELIRAILTGDDGATRDDGVAAYLDIRGTGTEENLDLDDVTLTEVTRQRVIGTVVVNGVRRQFKLRLPNVLSEVMHTGRGHSATAQRLVAPHPDNANRELLVAEFNWLE